MSSPKRPAISGSLVNSCVVGSNMHFGGGGDSSPKGVKRGKKSQKTKLANGTLVEKSVVDGIYYECGLSIGGYLVEMGSSNEGVDIDSVLEAAVKTGHVGKIDEGKSEPVLGLPNGARVQESVLCDKMYRDAVVVDGRFVEIEDLPDAEAKATALQSPVFIRESTIETGNLITGEWTAARVISQSSVIGKNNSIGGSMIKCAVSGDKNIFHESIEEVRVTGSNNEITHAMRSCEIKGSRNRLNSGFVNSHIKGSNNIFKKGLKNSRVSGNTNKFLGNAVDCNITGNKNEFGGDIIGCTMEADECGFGM